jgi:hypothetical protein
LEIRKLQVSGLIILHRNRISFFWAGVVRGAVQRYLVDMGPTCMGDPVIGAHMCVPVHRIYVHGGTVEGI